MFKLRKSNFLIKKSCNCPYVHFFWQAPAYQFICQIFDFSLFYCSKEFFLFHFSFLWFRLSYFYCHYYFLYVFWTIKSHPQYFSDHTSTINFEQYKNTSQRWIDFWTFSNRKNLDFLHLKFQFGIFLGYFKLTVWHFLRTKKLKMFKDYRKKLVLKYFGGKNIFCLLSEIFALSSAWFLMSDFFLTGCFFLGRLLLRFFCSKN